MSNEDQEQDNDQDQAITDAINSITEKMSNTLYEEYMTLPNELQLNIVLIKSAQLMLANVLCHAVETKEELDEIIEIQGIEVKELTLNCALGGFSDKFDIHKH